jgi:virginiamycin B lyase
MLERTSSIALALAGCLLIGTACAATPSARRVQTSPGVATPSAPSPRASPSADQLWFREFPVPGGARPHDVAPAPDGRVWYTAQRSGGLGVLDPATGQTRHIALGEGSAPHGVIVGPDGAPWVTDGGLDAIVRVDPETLDLSIFAMPSRPVPANLNTAAFDGAGMLWFTGQSGVYGNVDPASGKVAVFNAPRGAGPYGIASTPDGTVWLASLAGSYIGHPSSSDGRLDIVDTPTAGGGARRIWSDSNGRLWVTEWFAGNLARYDPASRSWREWRLPGSAPQPYAVFVDGDDVVWVTDFGANALVRFDPQAERFRSFPFPSRGAEVRQLLGRESEVWGAESGTDRLVVLRTN